MTDAATAFADGKERVLNLATPVPAESAEDCVVVVFLDCGYGYGNGSLFLLFNILDIFSR